MDIADRISEIEKEIRETPYHKGTERHIGLLRAKLSRLKEKDIESTSKKTGGGGGYGIKKQGDATIVLIGPPSVGKSTLLNGLTNAKSKVAPYAFTTVSVIPGMMEFKSAKLQILDVPGLIEGAEEGKGQGKQVLSVARGADLLILMTDIDKPHVFKNLEEVLYKNGVRVNEKPPDVRVEKKTKGGLIIHSNFKQDLDKETIKEIAKEFRLVNAEITIKEKLTIERLIDAFAPNRVFIPALFVLNKIDKGVPKDQGKRETITISAQEETNLENLKEAIWEKLDLVRIYLVKEGETPSKENPLIMKRETRLSDVAEKIGEEFAKDREKATIWGPGARFPGQEVPLTRSVEEGMMVRFER